jgi:5-methylcytosine-specific restriction endonuclease McrA
MADIQNTRKRVYSKEQRSRMKARELLRTRAIRVAYQEGHYILGSWPREATCEACENVFPMWRTGKRMRFCSRHCSGKDESRLSPEQLATKRATRKARQREGSRRRRVSRPQFSRVHFSHCAHCGRAFAAHYRRRMCSESCQQEHRAAQIRVVSRCCRRCGAEFRVTLGRRGSQRIFCSAACTIAHNKPIAAARRRARLKGCQLESVDRLVVFRRDGWMCHLCGVKTRRELMGTRHPLAPELDHVVPLAKGGAHTYANTACAHSKCNRAKGMRVLGHPSLFAAHHKSLMGMAV